MKHHFQDLGEGQPAVGGVAVILAHNKGLLTACDAIVGDISFVNSVGLKYLKERIVVKEGRGQHTGGKEEFTHLLIKLFGGIFMKLDRQNRLRQHHIEIGFHYSVGHFVRKVFSVVIAAAYKNVLRYCPAAVAYVIENEEMLKKLGRFGS